ncbi:murein transglycosylase [Sulfurimonas aquatica]|uniref:Murein transglycosylase n=1 Tax=Sulfurimonas aquatica TaxID=2672570 RepID=A0A975AY31_9BACT|nr:lytic murein transglycosylase [Sulfurimonas aquatica]QSZ40691.1 murein transglycosylase [Sulfurimonas aquatica]
MIKLLLLISLSVLAFAKYDNCKFRTPHYEDICKAVVKDGVSIKYANQFLTSYFKTKKFDEISWKYLQPNKLKTHQENEKKANNVLVKSVPKMVENIKKYKDVYDYAELEYGVNKEIIAAILLKETKLGEIKPTHDAFIVFNTMLTRAKPNSTREKWLINLGKTNMISIIKHCYAKDVTPEQCNLPSSYAGAVGIPQFMPNSFIYAESYIDKVVDLTKMEDAIVSVATFLNKKAGYNKPLDWNELPYLPGVESQWYEYEFKNKDASFVYETSKSGKIYQCFTKGKPELAYMKEYVKKIMRYNNSSNYAVGVMRLAYDAHLLLHQK